MRTERYGALKSVSGRLQWGLRDAEDEARADNGGYPWLETLRFCHEHLVPSQELK